MEDNEPIWYVYVLKTLWEFTIGIYPQIHCGAVMESYSPHITFHISNLCQLY